MINYDKLMIETDSPYMIPKNMNIRVKNNNPSYLTFVAKDISNIKFFITHFIFKY